ncbi:MAG: DNRLRE domain-containing protein [Chloroflexi bacterium]|nr:DNRLRE domain-containing protein [Chloroflexota bacterium]
MSNSQGSPESRVARAIRWGSLGILLLFALLATGAKPPSSVVVLQATDDAYIASDTAITDAATDTIRDQNFGSLDFIKVWYAWKVGGSTQQVISLGLVKFDLASLKDKEIASATLQLAAARADLTQPVRLVDVSETTGDWTQKDVTYNKKPTWGPDALATTAVYGAGVVYSWDVSGSVIKGAKAGKVSYIIGLRAVEDGKEEQVVFASRETGGVGPRLVVTYRTESLWGKWYVWAGGVAGAAVIALVLGMWIARRGRPAQAK